MQPYFVANQGVAKKQESDVWTWERFLFKGWIMLNYVLFNYFYD